MTGTDDRVTWLRAQLDDDERVARALFGAARFVGGAPDFYGVGGPAADAYWSHFVPARVLAEVDAKRRILDRYEDAIARQIDHDYSLIAADVQAEEYRDWVLPLLALPYAGRPGYREEWRP